MRSTNYAVWLLATCFCVPGWADEFSVSFDWDAKSAADYLDTRATWWMDSKTAARDRGTFCISCHTAVPYALARPALRKMLAEDEAPANEQRLLANVTKRVRFWSEVAPFYSDDKQLPVKAIDARPGDIKAKESRGTEAILNALILASNDASTESLSDDARIAFRNLWSLQEKTGGAAGAWPWLNFHNAPWEAEDSQYYGAALAAVAVGMASRGYRASSEIQVNLKLLREYLLNQRPSQSLANRLVLLWASTRWPGLLNDEQQHDTIDEANNKQQHDGGWSTASLIGTWKRRDGTPLDTRSDAYATGLMIFVLQQAGMSREQAHVGRGLTWLVQNQDKASGRWSASSLNKNRDFDSLAGPFMSDAATAYAVLALTAPAAAGAAKTAWPQFRGERAAGMAAEQNLPEEWNRTQNVRWVADVPGRGWSSPVVWGSRVFLTTVVNAAATKEPEQGFYRPMDVSIPDGEHEWTVLCLDADDGRTLWQRVVHRGKPCHTIHVKNNYAPETPATDGERVVVYFGNVGLFCFDLNGEPRWSQKWPAVPMRLGWGTGSSPIIHQDRVYVQNDNEEVSFLVALDKWTGAELWRTPRDEKSSWATPFAWEHALRTEIVTSATSRVRSYDLNGKLLWEFGGMSSICVPTPVAARELLIVSSGYEFARPRPIYAIRPGAKGDISLGQGQTSNEFIAWYREPAGAYHPTPLFDGQRLYVLYSRGTLACFDPQTGQDIYGQQRLGGSYTASPVACDGKIYCCDENGLTNVIQAGPEFKVLARNALNEMSLATPAIAGGRLYVRTLSHLYCLQNAAVRP